MAAVTTGVVVGGAAAGYTARQQRKSADRAAQAQAEGIDQARADTQAATDRALPLIQQGFQGAQQTLAQGGEGARSDLLGGLNPTLNELTQGYNQAQQTLSPMAQQGAGASQMQAALSGALGPQAQAEAFQNFRSSPGTDFLAGQQEQALLRNQAALGGGLGQSGRVMEALQEQAMGRAQTDFGNQFARLGQIAQRGDQASANIANLQASLGSARSGIRGGLAQALAGMQLDQSSQMAQLQANQGTTEGNLLIGQGSQQAQLSQNRGAALAGAHVFRSQQTPPIVQALQGGASAFGAMGGDLSSLLGGSAANPGATQAGYTGNQFSNWLAGQQ